jgi:hypothetical protein
MAAEPSLSSLKKRSLVSRSLLALFTALALGGAMQRPAASEHAADKAPAGTGGASARAETKTNIQPDDSATSTVPILGVPSRIVVVAPESPASPGSALNPAIGVVGIVGGLMSPDEKPGAACAPAPGQAPVCHLPAPPDQSLQDGKTIKEGIKTGWTLLTVLADPFGKHKEKLAAQDKAGQQQAAAKTGVSAAPKTPSVH